MEVQTLSPSVTVITGAVNLGVVETTAGLVAIDTGLDKQSGKRILRIAEEKGMPICGIINTHAHADHFGGNQTILAKYDVPVYAPRYEADVIQRPRYELSIFGTVRARYQDFVQSLRKHQ